MRPLARGKGLAARLFNTQVYQTRRRPKAVTWVKKMNYFKYLLSYWKFEGTALMKRQASQKRQIDAGFARERDEAFDRTLRRARNSHQLNFFGRDAAGQSLRHCH